MSTSRLACEDLPHLTGRISDGLGREVCSSLVLSHLPMNRTCAKAQEPIASAELHTTHIEDLL